MGQMFDIKFSLLGDGTIRLEQAGGIDEPSVVDLHPSQLQFIANHYGLSLGQQYAPDAVTLYRLNDIQRRAEELFEMLGAVLSFPPGQITDDVIAARDLADAITNLVEDITPPEHMRAKAPSADASVRGATDNAAKTDPVGSGGVPDAQLSLIDELGGANAC